MTSQPHGHDAPADNTGENTRRCCATGALRPRAELIRFILHEGQLYPDLDEKLPGRGLWLTPHPALLHTALKAGGFARSAKTKISADPDLSAQVERLLLHKVQSHLGLMRRAGAVLSGFEQVETALDSGKVRLRLTARDAGADSQKKLRAKARDMKDLQPLTAAEQGQALGRDQAVHVACLAHGLLPRLEQDAERLTLWRAEKAPEIMPEPPTEQNPFSAGAELLQEHRKEEGTHE